MNKEFLNLYDEKIDEIFLYSYEQTQDREVAKSITQLVFSKAWDQAKSGQSIKVVQSRLLDMAGEQIEREKKLHHIHISHITPVLKPA